MHVPQLPLCAHVRRAAEPPSPIMIQGPDVHDPNRGLSASRPGSASFAACIHLGRHLIVAYLPELNCAGEVTQLTPLGIITVGGTQITRSIPRLPPRVGGPDQGSTWLPPFLIIRLSPTQAGPRPKLEGLELFALEPLREVIVVTVGRQFHRLPSAVSQEISVYSHTEVVISILLWRGLCIKGSDVHAYRTTCDEGLNNLRVSRV